MFSSATVRHRSATHDESSGEQGGGESDSRQIVELSSALIGFFFVKHICEVQYMYCTCMYMYVHVHVC